MRKIAGSIGVVSSLFIVIYSWTNRYHALRDGNGDEVLKAFNLNMAVGFSFAMGIIGLLGSLLAFKFPKVSFFILSAGVFFLLLNGIFSLYFVSSYLSLLLVPSIILSFIESKRKNYY